MPEPVVVVYETKTKPDWIPSLPTGVNQMFSRCVNVDCHSFVVACTLVHTCRCIRSADRAADRASIRHQLDRYVHAISYSSRDRVEAGWDPRSALREEICFLIHTHDTDSAFRACVLFCCRTLRMHPRSYSRMVSIMGSGCSLSACPRPDFQCSREISDLAPGPILYPGGGKSRSPRKTREIKNTTKRSHSRAREIWDLSPRFSAGRRVHATPHGRGFSIPSLTLALLLLIEAALGSVSRRSGTVQRRYKWVAQRPRLGGLKQQGMCPSDGFFHIRNLVEASYRVAFLALARVFGQVELLFRPRGESSPTRLSKCTAHLPVVA